MTRAEQEQDLKARVAGYMRSKLDYDEWGIILYMDSDPYVTTKMVVGP